jgi:hypothetical protein
MERNGIQVKIPDLRGFFDSLEGRSGYRFALSGIRAFFVFIGIFFVAFRLG